MRGYIIGVKTFTTVEFQYLPRVKENRNLTTASFSVFGANNDVVHGVGGSSELTLDLGFYINSPTRDDVIEAIRLIEGFTYTGGNANEFEQVRIVLGKLYEGRKYLITSVESNPDLFDVTKHFYPQAAQIKVTFKQVFDNLNRSDIW